MAASRWNGWNVALCSIGCLWLLACGGDPHRLEITPIPDQIVAVGQEVRLAVVPEPLSTGGSYRFVDTSAAVTASAQLRVAPDGAGLFHWTPRAADLGVHEVAVVAAVGGGEARVGFHIDVRSAVGDATIPRFVAPLGAGTVLNVTDAPCLDVPVEISDQDSVQVALTQEPPLIDGAVIAQTGPHTALWSWCPLPAQVALPGRYALLLGADDGDNPKSLKSYDVILRNRKHAECPGEAPEIADDTAPAITSLAPVRIEVLVDDDSTLPYPPLLRYAVSASELTPDAGDFQYVLLTKLGAAGTLGAWATELPNPAAGLAMGGTRYLHYAIEVEDDDDPLGNCDHLTREPALGYRVIAVTTPGGTMDAPWCATCSIDDQCGVGDLCAVVGVFGSHYCLAACTSDGDCPAGSECAAAPVMSVDGQSARQCVPVAGTCAVTAACADDDHEDNDTRLGVKTHPPLAPGDYSLVMCPARVDTYYADEDWFKVVLPTQAEVTIETVAEDGADDLTLGLYSANGDGLALSAAAGQNGEIVRKCLVDGTYYVRVSALVSSRETPYLLSWSSAYANCAEMCVDDAFEPNDTAAGATATGIPATYSDMELCSLDEDWYRVPLTHGERLIVDLHHTQSSSAQDLDLHLYRQHGAGLQDLTPCSEDAPATCSAAGGQSGMGDEHVEHTAACADGDCVYYVVVRGWYGAANAYALELHSELPP